MGKPELSKRWFHSEWSYRCPRFTCCHRQLSYAIMTQKRARNVLNKYRRVRWWYNGAAPELPRLKDNTGGECSGGGWVTTDCGLVAGYGGDCRKLQMLSVISTLIKTFYETAGIIIYVHQLQFLLSKNLNQKNYFLLNLLGLNCVERCLTSINNF